MRILKMFICLAFLLSLNGCLNNKKVQSIVPLKRFEGPTNADLLTESLANIEINPFESGLISRDKKILIASLEQPGDSELDTFPVTEKDPIITFVEDGLFSWLSAHDYRALERDLNIMTRIFHEGDQSYIISIKPDLKTVDFIKDLLMRVGKSEGGGKISLEDLEKILQSSNLNSPFVRYPFNGADPIQHLSKFVSADYVLSYRVLECGIAYRPAPANNGSKMIERVAVTKLHLRLTEQDGSVVWADIVEGRAQDEIEFLQLPFAATNYEFASFKNPSAPESQLQSINRLHAQRRQSIFWKKVKGFFNRLAFWK